VAGRSFGAVMSGPARFDITKLGLVLEAIHERLASVTIECLDWRDFLTRWDRPGTLFFLDPPYFGTEGYYGPGLFSPDDHAALASALKGLKGRFILTMNDCPETRRIFRAFKIETADLSYQLAGGGSTRQVREIIVSGGRR
jgi:DNA adenine methylase